MAESTAKESGMINERTGGRRVSGGTDMFETTENSL